MYNLHYMFGYNNINKLPGIKVLHISEDNMLVLLGEAEYIVYIVVLGIESVQNKFHMFANVGVNVTQCYDQHTYRLHGTWLSVS